MATTYSALQSQSMSAEDDDNDDNVEEVTREQRVTRTGRIYSPAPAKSASAPPRANGKQKEDLAVVPETEELGDDNDDATTPPPSSRSPSPIKTSQKKGKRVFHWGDPGTEERVKRELKLAHAVHDCLAYDCSHKLTAFRWRKVIDILKGPNEGEGSILFSSLTPNNAARDNSSYRTVKKHFEEEFQAWERGEKVEARTSGAAASYGELERIYTLIQTDKENGLGKTKNNSYQNPGEGVIESALAASMGGTAFHRAAQQVQAELADGPEDERLAEKGIFSPKKKPKPNPPPTKGVRGAGAVSKASTATEMSGLSEVGILKVKMEAEASVRQHELDKKKLELEEKREAREERREEREERRAEREARQQEMMYKFMEKLAEKM